MDIKRKNCTDFQFHNAKPVILQEKMRKSRLRSEYAQLDEGTLGIPRVRYIYLDEAIFSLVRQNKSEPHLDIIPAWKE